MRSVYPLGTISRKRGGLHRLDAFERHACQFRAVATRPGDSTGQGRGHPPGRSCDTSQWKCRVARLDTDADLTVGRRTALGIPWSGRHGSETWYRSSASSTTDPTCASVMPGCDSATREATRPRWSGSGPARQDGERGRAPGEPNGTSAASAASAIWRSELSHRAKNFGVPATGRTRSGLRMHGVSELPTVDTTITVGRSDTGRARSPRTGSTRSHAARSGETSADDPHVRGLDRSVGPGDAWNEMLSP